MEHFGTNQKIKVTNYPYGHLKNIAFFSLEFKARKGFRAVFQTVNPKTNKLNNPKYGAYSPLIIMRRHENGFVDYIYGDFNGSEAIDRGAKIISENFNLFTSTEIEHFYLYILKMLKVEAHSLVTYYGADFNKIKAILEAVIDTIIEGLRTKTNLFDKIVLNDDLESCKIPGFNPFRVIKYDNFSKKEQMQL